MSDHSVTPDTAAVDLTTRRPPPRSTSKTTTAPGPLRQALIIYLLSALATLAPIVLLFDYMIAFNLGVIAPCIGVGALWLAGVLALRRVRPLRTAFAVGLGVWAGLSFLFTFAYTAFGLLEPQGYGDRVCSVMFLENGIVVERWFLGTAIWNWMYAAVWQFPLSPRLFPEGLATAEACIRITGASVMLGAAAVLLGRWGTRMSIVLPLLSPMWILLAAGYVEYYPMVAGLLMGYLVYVFELPGGIAARSSLSAGIWLALLPLSYIAYAPLAALLLAFYALARPRELDKTLGIFLVAFVLLLGCCYPKPIAEFFPELYKNMQWTGKDTYAPYRHQELFDGSNFLNPVFALSPAHLKDLLYMYFFGGGLIFPALLGVFAYLARPRTRQEALALFRKPAFLFAAILLGWELFYFATYNARLGPRGDIDLFFATFLTVAFFAGYLADRLVERGDLREETLPLVVAACAGSSCVSVVYLFSIGLPQPL